MKAYLVKMFGVSLVITMIVELLIAFLFWIAERVGNGRRNRAGSGADRRKASKLKNRLFLVILVNLLTNPMAVLLCWLGRMYLPLFLAFPVQVIVEIAVVVVEAYIYHSFAKKPRWQIAWPVLLAVVANICSWLLGLVVNQYIWILDYLEMFIR